jgi:hypothetical protein
LSLRRLLQYWFLSLFWFICFKSLLWSIFLWFLRSWRLRRLWLFHLLFCLFWSLILNESCGLLRVNVYSIQRFSDSKSISFFNEEFSKDSSCCTFDFYSNFICLNIRDSLIKLYPITFLLSKLSYSSFGNRICNLWEWEYFFLVLE